MKGRLWKIIVASLAVVAAISCAVLFLPTSQGVGTKCEGKNMLSLTIPRFVSAAGEGTNFLEEEAGISGYADVGEEIDLNEAKSVFRTIERETEEYVVGSVPLPGYAESEDVHCYVHKDGWVVTYYLQEEPAAKIVDWNSYGGAEITSTKLENGIAEICSAAGVPFTESTYYHFQYPNAENLMIAADAQFGPGTDTFNLIIPSDLVVYERSWSHYASSSSSAADSILKLDGNTLNHIDFTYVSGNEDTGYGWLSSSDLQMDVSHTISINNDTPMETGFDAIILIYREG